MRTLFILGRQPALGRAELESLYGADALRPWSANSMIYAGAAAPGDFARLGGSVKMCSVLETIEGTDWRQLQAAVVAAGLRLGQEIAEGKIQLGVSAYGLRLSTRQLTAAGLEVKKALRSAGRSVRLVQNQEPALNSAQVLHNHLTGERGLELVLASNGKQTLLGYTLAEQDITAYTERDRGRPKRDARVGMLPPKLAQTIINLATSSSPPSSDFTVLDPFCGTGVVLQEALLMGFSAYGTDLEPRMIAYSQANLDWLAGKTAGFMMPHLEAGDATAHHWNRTPNAVACETYLGQPYATLPPRQKLQENIRTCNTILEKFLQNIAAQIAPGTRLCVAVPAWQHKPGQFTHLPLLDHLDVLGYNRIDFRYAQSSELIYYRPDQIVARELLVITRK